jgi:DUF1680 family protein
MRVNGLADFIRCSRRRVVFTVAILLSTAKFFSIGGPAGSVRPVIPEKAQSFPLSQVRLLGGPFRDAMLRDEKYLLSLDPDRLLHMFRLNVGLPSTARPLGGWEAPMVELRGHSLGHYLSALSLMYASTGNAVLKQRVEYIVGELAKCQNNAPAAGFHAGFLSAFPESFIDRVEMRRNVWAPWYTLHKIMAGLLDANQLCGNAQALDVLTRMADWVKFRVDRLSHEQMQRSLDTEHGGMNEVLANLYAVTGNESHLQLSAAFNHERVLDPLSRGEDRLNGLHANTQIPKIIGATREYEFTGNPKYLAIANTFWDAVALHRSYVIGGDSDRESFFPTSDFARHLSPETAETCNTYNMLKLTRDLFEVEPDAKKMDFYERALYNHILASQDPQTGMFVYLMSLKPGHFKTYSTPEDSFWCCVGTGMENHAKYGDTIYFHDANSLYVNLFIASQLSWPEKDLTVRQETKFPESDTTVLKFKAAKPVNLALKIRHPSWAAKDVTVSVNGRKQKIETVPESYFTLQREWRDEDKIEIRLPMSLRTEFLPDTTNEVAVLYGPVVLAGELGTDGMPNPPMATTQTAYSRVPAPAVPMFASAADSLVRHIKPVSGKPLTFRTRGIGRPKDVTLIPFFQLHRQRYAVYWRLITEADWKTISPEFAAAEKQRIAEEARVIDVVRPGEQQSETDHNMRGEDTQAGDAFGFKWRSANAWFSYDVKVAEGQENQLVVSFRGDRNAADFDVSVDGKVLSPQRAPGGPNDAAYELPPELTQGRRSITVKFAARPGKSVPAVTQLRVLRSDATR